MIDDIIAKYKDQVILDKEGALKLVQLHGMRGVSRLVLKKKLGKLPKFFQLKGFNFYNALDDWILSLSQREAHELGLSNNAPPEHIHFIARARLSFFDFRNADAFCGNLKGAGFKFTKGVKILDFGSSSGRTIKTFAEAYPQCDWYGVDPMEPSIEWAKQVLPHITFATSPQEPPLDFEDGYMDAIYAASIWSHFSERAALVWFDEMHRILSSGGFLCFTTHGFYDVAKKIAQEQMPPEVSKEVVGNLMDEGFSFWGNIKEGHRGLEVTDWGTAFFQRKWVEEKVVGSKWKLVSYKVGQWGGRQDIYVLQKLG